MKSILSLVAIALLTNLVYGQPLPEKRTDGYHYVRNGQEAFAGKFLYATDFTGTIALVKTETGWGYIDTTGVFLTDSDYTSAEILHSGSSARVYRGKNVGLINFQAKTIFKTEFDSIQTEYPAIFKAWKGGKATIALSTMVLSEVPVYLKFEHYGDYISGRKSDGSWTVWYKGRLLSDDARLPVDSRTYDYNSGLLKLSSKGRYGLHSPDKGWVAEPKYDTICRQTVAHYQLESQMPIDFVYVLDEEITYESGNYVMTNFRLVDAQGGSISDQLCLNRLENPLNEGLFQVRTEKGMIRFGGNGAPLSLPYRNLVDYSHECLIATELTGKQSILNKNYKPIATFDSVFFMQRYFEGVDENGVPTIAFMGEPFVPYFQVAKKADGKLLTALYSHEEQRVVSPFMQTPLFRNDYESQDHAPGYIYRERDGKLYGFYFPGMTTGTGLIYRQVNFLPGRRIRVDTQDGKSQVLEVIGGKAEVVLEADVIFRPAGLAPYYGTESETGSKWYMTTFQTDFICTQNMNGKLGMLALNGVHVPERFDSIGQNRYDKFIDVCENGLYGVVNLRDGKVIEPYATMPLEVGFHDGSMMFYVSDTNGYRDSRGRFYSFTPDGEFDFYKQKARYGLMTISDFTGDTIKITPPVYRKIEGAPADGSLLYMVRGDEGYGLINFRADTIVPLIYDKFEPAYHQDGMLPGLWMYKDKKKGAAIECKGVVVPALYDEVEDLYEWGSGTSSGMKVTLDGKQGYYAYDGTLVLPVVFDLISIKAVHNDNGATKVIHVLKDGKWGVKVEHVLPQDDFCYRYEKYFPVIDTNSMMKFDLVVNDFGFVINNGLYTQFDYLLSKEVSSPAMHEKDMLIMSDGYDFFFENGKVGIKLSEGKVIQKAQFTNIRALDSEHVIVLEDGTEHILNIYTNKRTKITQW